MTKSATRPAREHLTRLVAPPGEALVVVTVWDATDESKRHDPRYWYTPELLATLRRAHPTNQIHIVYPHQRSQGYNIEQLREMNNREGWVELAGFGAPSFTIAFSLAPYRDAPKHTWMIFYYSHGDDELLLPDGVDAVPEVEAARAAIRDARASGDQEQLVDARRTYFELMSDERVARPVGADYDLETLVELQPCVEIEPGRVEPAIYVDDQRPVQARKPARRRASRKPQATAVRPQPDLTRLVAPPGEALAVVTVWDATDESKLGDPRYWYTPELLAAMRRLSPTSWIHLTGPGGISPQGYHLEWLLRDLADEEGQIELAGYGAPSFNAKFSLEPYRNGPEWTGMIFYYSHGDDPLLLPEHCDAVPEVAAARSAIRDARASGDQGRLAYARAAYFELMRDERIARPVGADYNLETLVELQPCAELEPGRVEPAIYIDDQRPLQARQEQQETSAA